MAGVLYLLLFVAPQVLVFLYLRERLPDPRRPAPARRVRLALATVFALANLPWFAVADRVMGGRFWGIGRIPYIAPFVAWQLLGWVFCLLIAAYVLAKAAVGVWGRWRSRSTDSAGALARRGAVTNAVGHVGRSGHRRPARKRAC